MAGIALISMSSVEPIPYEIYLIDRMKIRNPQKKMTEGIIIESDSISNQVYCLFSFNYTRGRMLISLLLDILI